MMRKITFDTVEDAIGAVEDFSDGLGCNVTITSEADGTFMFFGHGEKVATWIYGDRLDECLSDTWCVEVPTQHPLYFLRTHSRASFCAY